jgi:hypothetical protein
LVFCVHQNAMYIQFRYNIHAICIEEKNEAACVHYAG